MEPSWVQTQADVAVLPIQGTAQPFRPHSHTSAHIHQHPGGVRSPSLCPTLTALRLAARVTDGKVGWVKVLALAMLAQTVQWQKLALVFVFVRSWSSELPPCRLFAMNTERGHEAGALTVTSAMRACWRSAPATPSSATRAQFSVTSWLNCTS
jgi:hypothetical protein